MATPSSDSDPAPQGPVVRERITAPVQGRRRRVSVVSEIDALSGVGEAYMGSLIRSQLRLAGAILGLLGLTIGMLPIALVVIPGLREADWWGVPAGWWLLGAGCYPVLIALAVGYVRRAERNERDFNDLVGPP